MWNNWIDTHEFRGLTSYELAFERWQKAEPLHKNGQDAHYAERKLKRNRQTIYSIRMCRDSSIACKYHDTDVVTFAPDGSITLRPYASNPTSQFANSFLPSGVYADFNNRHGVMLHLGSDREYKLGTGLYGFEAFTIRKDAEGQWQVDDSEPFEVPYVVTATARETLKRLDFRRFRQWVNAACMLNQSAERQWTRGYSGDELADVYEDRASWPELLNVRAYYPDRYETQRMVYGKSLWGSPKLTQPERSARQAGRIINAMRLALYKAHDCIGTDTLPYVSGWKQLETIAAANRRLGD